MVLPSQLRTSHHEEMAKALLAGLTEILRRLDVLAGRRLVYIGGVRQDSGSWHIDRFELMGDSACRLEAARVPRDLATRLPDANRAYLEIPGAASDVAALRSLHPLLLYEPESGEVLIFNRRKGRSARRTEYLCYTTGLTSERVDSARDLRR